MLSIRASFCTTVIQNNFNRKSFSAKIHCENTFEHFSTIIFTKFSPWLQNKINFIIKITNYIKNYYFFRKNTSFAIKSNILHTTKPKVCFWSTEFKASTKLIAFFTAKKQTDSPNWSKIVKPRVTNEVLVENDGLSCTAVESVIAITTSKA